MSLPSVEVIEASQCATSGVKLITMVWRYHRFIHGEVMTHRVFSRNAMSSRAVPIRKMLAQVWSDPAMPLHWGATQPGMQAHNQLTGWRLRLSRGLWKAASKVACAFAWSLMKLGLAKQVANRILEPWQWMHTIVTATEWDNFFALRCHPDAQPEFQYLANLVKSAADNANYKIVNFADMASPMGWHLPFVTQEERLTQPLRYCIQASAARCARVSYLTHEGQVPSIEKDLGLFHKLAGSAPIHASPLEHQAFPAQYGYHRSNNLKGWEQFRWHYENRDDPMYPELKDIPSVRSQ